MFRIRSRYRRYKAYRIALRKTLERIRESSGVVCELGDHAPVVGPAMILHPDFPAAPHNSGNRPMTRLPYPSKWIEAKCGCEARKYWVAVEHLSAFTIAARQAEIMAATVPQVGPWWRRA